MYFSEEENHFNLFEDYDDDYNRRFFDCSDEGCGINYDNLDEFDKINQGSTDVTESKELSKESTELKSTQDNENPNSNLVPFQVKQDSFNVAFKDVFEYETNRQNESIVLIPEPVKEEELKKEIISKSQTGNTISNKSIKENITSDNNKAEEFVGKKRKENNFSTEKIIKRVRIVVLKAIIHFINEKIKLFYNNNIGKGLKEMKFKEIDKTTLSHSKVEYDKEFLNFPLKKILSWDISGKMTNFLKEHNKNLVEKLLNSETCSEYFKELFDMTFTQCLEHIQNQKYGVLNGLMGCRKMFEEFCDEKEINDEGYYSNFEEILLHYQEMIEAKTPRKPRKKNS